MSIFRRNNTEQDTSRRFSVIRDVLPYTVREQLASSGRIDYRAIEELMVPDRQQQRFGFYAAMKAANSQPDLQLNLVERFVVKDADFSELTREDVEPILQTMRDADISIEADKLAEISRKGFDNWVDFFMQRFEQIVPTGAPVYLLAHSPSVCLDRILQSRGSVSLLLPKQFESGETVGMEINERNRSVSTIAREFIRPDDALLIDDIRNTGKAEIEALNFWGQSPCAIYLAMASVSNESRQSSTT